MDFSAILRLLWGILVPIFVLAIGRFIYLLFLEPQIYENDFISSIWCSPGDLTNRSCLINNLCLYKGEFIFLHHPEKSLEIGLSNKKFNSPLTDLSSVNNHNQFYFNLIQLPHEKLHQFLKHENASIRFINGLSIIFSRFKPDNLMHFLHDDLLPLLTTSEYLKFFSTDKQNMFIIDSLPPVNHFPINNQFYKNVFTQTVFHNQEVPSYEMLCFEKTHIGLRKDTIWYDYGFRSIQHSIEKSEDQKKLIRQITKTIQDLMSSKKECHEPKSISIITRKINRLIINEQNMIEMLKKNFSYKVNEINLDDDKLNMGDIISSISCSSAFIGVHGAGLSLAMFLPKNAYLIEIFPYLLSPESLTPFANLAKIYNLSYFAIETLFEDDAVGHPEYIAEHGGLADLDSAKRYEILYSKKKVQLEVCCNDRPFLYRVYQDTRVNLDNLATIIQSIDKNVSLDHSVSNQFFPGPLKKIVCEIQNKTQIHLSWDDPWNLKFLDNLNRSKIKYEIIFEQSKEQFTYISELKSFKIYVQKLEKFNIWIRCTYNTIRGPYNLVPIQC